MGLGTIDSLSQKEHTEIHKIPKFGSPCRTASGLPYISLFIQFDIFKWLYLIEN